MATSAYWTWVNAGRPFRRPPWLVSIKARARAAGVAFLGDLGSDDERHLQASTPQDHCPFSFTAWPVALPDYVICAIDLADGDWSDRILEAARRGDPAYRWLKYLNFRGKNYSIKRNNFHDAVSSSDAHLHLSGRSDCTWLDTAANPFTEGDDMLQEDERNWLAESAEAARVTRNTDSGLAIVARDVAEIKARPAGNVTMTAEDRTAIVDELRGEVASTVEATLRRVLGGLDNPPGSVL